MPESTGEWEFKASFRWGEDVAISDSPSAGMAISFDGAQGRFLIAPRDKPETDMRGKGRLDYIGQRYLQFQGNKNSFSRQAQTAENFLAYSGIDDTYSHNPNKQFLKEWEPHVRDWQSGDPSWQGAKERA